MIIYERSSIPFIPINREYYVELFFYLPKAICDLDIKLNKKESPEQKLSTHGRFRLYFESITILL